MGTQSVSKCVHPWDVSLRSRRRRTGGYLAALNGPTCHQHNESCSLCDSTHDYSSVSTWVILAPENYFAPSEHLLSFVWVFLWVLLDNQEYSSLERGINQSFYLFFLTNIKPALWFHVANDAQRLRDFWKRKEPNWNWKHSPHTHLCWTLGFYNTSHTPHTFLDSEPATLSGHVWLPLRMNNLQLQPTGHHILKF